MPSSCRASACAYRPRRSTFASVFGREAPVVVEIGFGMGETTARIAARESAASTTSRSRCTHPAWAACSSSSRSTALTNVRVVQHDAVEVLRDMVPPGSLAGHARVLPRSVAEEAPPQAPAACSRHSRASPPSASRPAASCTSRPIGRSMPSMCSRCLRASTRLAQYRGGLRAAARHASRNQVRAPWPEAGPRRVGHCLHEEAMKMNQRRRELLRVVAAVGAAGASGLIARGPRRGRPAAGPASPRRHRDGERQGRASRARRSTSATRSRRGADSQAVVVLKGDAFLLRARHRRSR